jgi:hypothetical protein
MKHYLKIEIESNSSEIIMKVEPVYCSLEDTSINIKQDDYVPTKGDKLYFLPGVNIPRVKMKDLTIQYGIKSVRNIDDATHIFAGRNTGPKMMDHTWIYRMPTETFRKIYEACSGTMDDYYTENIREALEYYPEDVVLFSYETASEIRNCENKILEAAIDDVALRCARNSNTTYLVDDDYKEYFPAILNLDIYDESKLLKYINGDDAVVIDSIMFEQLSDMFKSSDNDNHILAMEIMANCNYIDSLLYIELLFKEYYYQMSHCPTKNHVNFKSLLSFLGKNKNYMSTSIDEVMSSLIRKQVLSTDKIDIIMKRYADEIEDRGNTTYFKVKTITLSEEALKTVNANYTYEISEDFIPEEVEETVDLNLIEEIADTEVSISDELEISDEDIETALLRINRKELKSELVALEESVKGPEEESNNNQIEETNDTDDFEWF